MSEQEVSAVDEITISLEIENTYEDDSEIRTYVTDAVIPAPPSPDDEAAYDAWKYDHIFSFTGTGREKGDSWYDVTVTACSDSSLVGQTFEFGY